MNALPLPALACVLVLGCGARVEVDAARLAAADDAGPDAPELCPDGCDDADPCTLDQCTPDGCAWAAVSGNACDHPDVNGPGVCVYGACVAACVLSVDCMQRPCRLPPACVSGACAYQPISDGKPCTVDNVGGTCSAGYCVTE